MSRFGYPEGAREEWFQPSVFPASLAALEDAEARQAQKVRSALPLDTALKAALPSTASLQRPPLSLEATLSQQSLQRSLVRAHEADASPCARANRHR